MHTPSYLTARKYLCVLSTIIIVYSENIDKVQATYYVHISYDDEAYLKKMDAAP